MKNTLGIGLKSLTHEELMAIDGGICWRRVFEIAGDILDIIAKGLLFGHSLRGKAQRVPSLPSRGKTVAR